MDNVQVIENDTCNSNTLCYFVLKTLLKTKIFFIEVLLSLIIFLQVPFESILDVEKFTVRILQKDIPRIIDIITAIPETEVEQMRCNVHKVWQRYEI